MPRLLKLLLPCVVLIASCQKYADEPGNSDPRLSRKYCNDPEAVNYNLDFPGTVDNSVCYYPADAFAGNYFFKDSVFGNTTTLVRIDSFNLRLVAISRTKFSIAGFCPSGDLLKFTANRALRASGDTTILYGQRLCRDKDTVSGQLTRTLADSTHLHFSLTVVTDTGTTTHLGTAVRQ